MVYSDPNANQSICQTVICQMYLMSDRQLLDGSCTIHTNPLWDKCQMPFCQMDVWKIAICQKNISCTYDYPWWLFRIFFSISNFRFTIRIHEYLGLRDYFGGPACQTHKWNAGGWTATIMNKKAKSSPNIKFEIKINLLKVKIKFNLYTKTLENDIILVFLFCCFARKM